MRKWLLHIFLVSVLGMLTASCSQNADDPTQDVPSKSADTEKVTIRFTIDLGEQSGMSSRAAWDGYDGVGTDQTDAENGNYAYENNIDLSTLQVIVLDLDGNYKGTVSIENVVRDPESTNKGRRYTFDGRLDVPKNFIVNQRLKCKLMVVANYDGNVINESGNTINFNSIFSYDHSTHNPNAVTGKKYIPMWGIATYEGIDENSDNVKDGIFLHPGIIQPLETPIYMLRSMAKIEVTLHGDVYNAGYRIKGVTLNKYINQGYFFPTFKADDANQTTTLGALNATTALGDEEVLHAVTATTGTGANVTTFAQDLVFGSVTPTYNFVDYQKDVTTEAGKSFVIYVPEIINDNSYEMYLRLGKSDGTDITANVMQGEPTIPLKNHHENNVSWDGNIVRNHCYRYTINSISDGYQLALTCVVQDWSEADVEEWDFTDQVSLGEGGKLVFGTMSGDTFTANATQTKEVVTTGGELVCQFHIATPTESIWQAEFIATNSDSNNAFVFVSDNGTESATATGNVGEKATLVIKPANANIDQNKSALLRISVRTKEGRTIVVKDLLPDNLGVNEYTITHSK